MEKLSNYLYYLTQPDWEGIGTMFLFTVAFSIISAVVLYVLTKLVKHPTSALACAKVSFGVGAVTFIFSALFFGVIEYHAATSLENQEILPYTLSAISFLVGFLLTKRYIAKSSWVALLIMILTSTLSYLIFVSILYSGLIPFN